MAQASEHERADFEQAMGEAFGQCVCPPVAFEDASAHECCEVVWSVAGRAVTPKGLATLTDAQRAELCHQFGAYFGTASPSLAQIDEAIAQTLARWPIGSVGE